MDELNDGRKISDFYSDRNFTDYQGGYSSKLPIADDKPTTPPLSADLSPQIKELIDNSPTKGRDMALIGRKNFTPAVLDYLLQFERGARKSPLSH
ncbi:hypothetical protein NHP21005_11860 [Helicobacter sp. NHP21005]|uniref:hypothetical protein n=1 Tax=Helicobacter felistomachi TaxID=3040201 RepID=UPI0025744CC5|nr:hypothetical protein [Helicobacter sp. NHP21005]BEG57498.1 hypothetical protein NHP21005_11860 [Helicobacter sp. NHP21005]